MVHLDIRYKKPARLGDSIEVTTEVTETTNATISLRHRALKEETLLVESHVKLVARGEEASTDNAQFVLGLYEDVAQFVYESDDDRNWGILTMTEISLDTWYSTTGVFDRDGNLKIYLNGLFEDEVIYSTTPSLVDQSVFIGAFYSAFSVDQVLEFFPGIIDDVRIYSRGLSDDVRGRASGRSHHSRR